VATEVEYQRYLAAFVQEMRRLGWSEGQNLRLEVRWNAGNAVLSDIYAKELIGLMPDVLVTASTVNLTAVQQVTKTIPIVFVPVADPLTQGFVSSMRQPGGNVTGFSLIEFSLAGKWLNLLKEIAPALERVAVMINPDTLPLLKFYVPVFDAAGRSLGVKVSYLPVLTESEIAPALIEFAAEPNGGLMVLGSSFMRPHYKEIANLAGRHRLPSIGLIGLASVGGLVDYGPSFDQARHFGQAATYVDRILRGAKAGDLPVQAPTKYNFVLNLRTAKALGLNVPLPLRGLADPPPFQSATRKQVFGCFQYAATGATVEPVAPSSFNGCIISANSLTPFEASSSNVRFSRRYTPCTTSASW
jgi:putative ABC transport system substrate-binding protein